MQYRKFNEPKILIATSNVGKYIEIFDLLSQFNKNIKIESLESYSVRSPEETGHTFRENAILKAHYYSEITKLPTLADDSGLVVDALKGEPGVHSARWAGEEKDFNLAVKKIEHKLMNIGEKSSKASFICGICLRWTDGYTQYFEGKVTGTIDFPSKGTGGFGYDSIFIPDGYDKTFAELGNDVKNKISHRAMALNMLVSSCF